MCQGVRVTPDKVGIVGLGLIGGSLLRALSAAGVATVGYDGDPGTRALARTEAARQPAGHRWEVARSVAGATEGADLVVLAVPLTAITEVLDELVASGYDGLVTDVTSVKGPVYELIGKRFPGLRYVGGHPMAGRETSGFSAGEAQLFHGAAWALCLEPDTSPYDWLAVARLVLALNARVVPVTAADHDAAVARISHLPHLVAAALAATAADPLCGTLAAGSFRDGTRVAAAAPALVATICGGNAGPVRAALDELLADLESARDLLGTPDPIAALPDWLARGQAVRTRWPAAAGPAEQLPADLASLLDLGRAGGWIVGLGADGRSVTAVRPA